MSMLSSHEEAEQRADEVHAKLKEMQRSAETLRLVVHLEWGGSPFCGGSAKRFLSPLEEYVTCGRCQKRIGKQDLAG